MWLFELADALSSFADLVHGLGKFVRGVTQGAAEGSGGAFDDPEELPAPVVPEPPPPTLPDSGWEQFAPRERPF